MKRKLQKFLPILVVLIGICLLAYPWISNYLHDNRADSTINSYNEDVKKIDKTQKKDLLKDAKEFNRVLASSNIEFKDPFDTKEKIILNYFNILNINKSGMMATIDIPKINVHLPIYHGTSDDVLQKGVGHLQGSSFPVGGKSTHCVLSAHTGLNSAKLFTDLVDLEKEDLFFISVVDQKLAYKVIEIQTVLPEDVSSLHIKKGKDLITLVTCTPYGVNSHRLLVTGERTKYTEQEVKEEAAKQTVGQSQWQRSYEKAIILGVVLILILIFLSEWILRRRRKKRQAMRKYPWEPPLKR